MPMPLDRRQFLALAGAGAALGRTLAVARRKPNIVLIVADDLGYADIGFHGCRDIPTPHLDSITRNGVRFADGYVCAPMCSPSRAACSPAATAAVRARVQPRPRGGLPTSEITLANVLKSAGYATGLVGKWHLGSEVKFRPRHRGFDEFFGFLLATHSYVKHAPAKLRSLFRDGQAVHEAEYLTDAFAREATDFITGTAPTRFSSTWRSTRCTADSRPHRSTSSVSPTSPIPSGASTLPC